jgi:HK97 family phage major capsid protein
MPTLTEMTDDERLIHTIRADFVREADALRSEMRRELTLVKQRTSRPPGAADANAAEVFRRPPSAGLAGNSAFQEFVTTTKTRRSAFAIELLFEIRAVTPITGVGLPAVYPPLVGPPQPALRVQQLMYHVAITGGSVIFTKETGFTPGADLVPEGTLKPGTTMTFANQTLTVQTVATIAKASIQSLQDSPMLMNWIDSRLSYAVLLRQEGYLLNDATNGLLALAPVQTPTTGATALDMVAEAIGSLKALGYSQTAS